MVYSGVLRNTYDQVPPNLIEGMITRLERVITAPNAGAKLAKILTITPVVTDTSATTYRLREINTGRLITTAPTAANPTAAQASDVIRNALKADPVLNGLFTMNANGSATVILTARQPGTRWSDFGFVDAGSTPVNTIGTPVVTQAASDGVIIPMGRGLTLTNASKWKLPDAALAAGSGVCGGIACFDLGDAPSSVALAGTSGYRVNDAMSIMKKGQVAVLPLTAVDPTQPVYMGYGTNQQGMFAASAIANSSQVTQGLSWATTTPLGQLALLDVNLP